MQLRLRLLLHLPHGRRCLAHAAQADSPTVVEIVAHRLSELAAAQNSSFSLVFHGGEPLLVGATEFADICGTLRRKLPFLRSHLQTNGTLPAEDGLTICAQHDVGVSISVDGPAQVHDRHRLNHRGSPSHARVMAAIRRLRAHQAGSSLFAGVLAVVDLASAPAEVYAFLKSTGAPSIDFLYSDGNHDTLPIGKASLPSTEYGDWMGRLLDIYLADPKPTRVRVLDDMLKLLLGGEARKEGVGLNTYGILVIDTDGSVNKNDTLKSAFRAADQFSNEWSVQTHDLREIVNSTEFAAYHRSQRPAAPACLACPNLKVCWRRNAGTPLEPQERLCKSKRILCRSAIPHCFDATTPHEIQFSHIIILTSNSP